MDLAGNRTLLSNASSLVGTWGITSALGLIYWLIAAHTFPPAAVGFASAAVAAMTLLGALATMGLDTLLMGELASLRGSRKGLVAASIAVAAAVGACLGAVFAVAASRISDNLHALASSPLHVLLFAVGVGATTSGMVLDQALVGILRGGSQLRRNALFALLKIALVLTLAAVSAKSLGVPLYATWVFALVISLLVYFAAVVIRAPSARLPRPQFAQLRTYSRRALEHHVFNLALKTPSMALPILVAALVSTRVNAGFYAASMIAGALYVIPGSLATVLFAVGSARRSEAPARILTSLRISIATTVIGAVTLALVAGPILTLFGNSYPRDATWSLRILALAGIPLIVKMHYASITRLSGRVATAIPVVLAGTALELTLATLGAQLYGVNGVSVGWALALCVEATWMLRTVVSKRREALVSARREEMGVL